MLKLRKCFIIYDLDYWPVNPIKNFTLGNCSFKNDNKSKYVYTGSGIAFDEQVYRVLAMTLLEIKCYDFWSRFNSSIHTDNRKIIS